MKSCKKRASRTGAQRTHLRYVPITVTPLPNNPHASCVAHLPEVPVDIVPLVQVSVLPAKSQVVEHVPAPVETHPEEDGDADRVERREADAEDEDEQVRGRRVEHAHAAEEGILRRYRVLVPHPVGQCRVVLVELAVLARYLRTH
eukprot:5248582-Pleurochrysis_carterae.AAC.2